MAPANPLPDSSRLLNGMEMSADGDCHTHMFNAGFVPIEGIVLSRGWPKELAEVLATFFEQEVEKDWPGATKPKDLSSSDLERLQLYEMLGNELVETESRRTPTKLIVDVVRLIPEQDIASLRPDLRRIRDKLVETGTSARVTDRELLRLLLTRAHKELGTIETGPPSSGSRSVSPWSLLRWLLHLLVHESRIEAASRHFFRQPPNLEFRVHHMMDMERHYPSERVLYDREERETRMLALANKPPRLIGFVAFCPFREDGLKIVSDAITAGFSGVKFYPPNGYRPIGNTESDLPNGPAPEVVNRRNRDLFELCADTDMDVPIFTHCNPGGMEARKKTGLFSDPAGWERVLADPALVDLPLCFGHAGGQDSWLTGTFESFQKSWAGNVVGLCTYPNVYCEFGYFDGILSKKGLKRFADRLESVVLKYPYFATKCCFGSDWHLIEKESRSSQYAQIFASMLENNSNLQPHRDAIMGGNLRTFLKLPPN